MASDLKLLSLRVDDLLDAVAARTPAPGGGATAALTTAMAAALVAMAGRYTATDGQSDPPVHDLVERAEGLRVAAAACADADAAAYGDYLAATRLPRDVDPEGRRRAVERALSDATDVPLAVVELASQVAALGAALVESGNPRLRGDAAAATLLASAAAATGAVLVAENLRGQPDDPRLGRAAAAAATARSATSAVAALLPDGGPSGAD